MGQPSHTGKTEKIMNKTTTHKDSLDVCADLRLLEDHELDSVSGGWFCCFASGEQLVAAQTFAKVLQNAGQV
jgi:hypothetical protein